MLETLISSKTRLKLLLKFFLNSQSKSYLRNLESEFGESTNAIRLELNKFESAGMLNSSMEGNKRYYQVNQEHPLFSDIHNMVLKYVGIDKIIENVARKLGNVESVYLVGDYAEGRDTGVIDLLLLGEELRFEYLAKWVKRAEGAIDRRIRFLTFNDRDDLMNYLAGKSNLLLWTN